MNYSYTYDNQLERPCSYMYSVFGGAAFLAAYRQSRLAMIAALPSVQAQDESAQDQQLLARWRGQLERLAVGAPVADLPQARGGDLARFDLTQTVSTEELLDAMLECLPGQERWSFWLARLVQRFEVTKKLYQLYPPGFRKGEGGYENLAHYRKLALLLTHGFAESGSLVYLNALLKVNDLMFSALEPMRWSRSAMELLALLANAELRFVARLGTERGVSSAG
ncbi:MAG TPA: hypothetical protein VGK09_06625 [Rhodocyclaceae bacterium]|jgi:hypothetical protein